MCGGGQRISGTGSSAAASARVGKRPGASPRRKLARGPHHQTIPPRPAESGNDQRPARGRWSFKPGWRSRLGAAQLLSRKIQQELLPDLLCLAKYLRGIAAAARGGPTPDATIVSQERGG